MATKISEHFTWEELTTTNLRGVNNTPGPVVRQNLQKLCLELLEGVRALVGPMWITSGYRSPEVNAKIGGSPTSAHLRGLAADWVPVKAGVSLLDAVTLISESSLSYDQLIYEYGRWIHIGLNPKGDPNRRQTLMIFRPGAYLQFDPRKIPQ